MCGNVRRNYDTVVTIKVAIMWMKCSHIVMAHMSEWMRADTPTVVTIATRIVVVAMEMVTMMVITMTTSLILMVMEGRLGVGVEKQEKVGLNLNNFRILRTYCLVNDVSLSIRPKIRSGVKEDSLRKI